VTGRTSPTTDRRDRRGGFTLLELTLALAILSLIAALALPRVYPGSGATTGRATAYAIAAALRNDRNAAIAGGSATTTRIDAAGRLVASQSGGGRVEVPADFDLTVATPGQGRNDGRIRFMADGRSSGGVIVLKREKLAYTVRVDPVTGGVQILTGAP
jgi:general secretion pathway protein H